MGKLRAKKPEDVTTGHCKGMIFGKSGAGKSWFVLDFPKPYLIDTEGGARRDQYKKKLKDSDGAYLGPDEGSNDFEFILEEIKSLATEKHPYKTLIVDSITKVFQTAIAKESERLGDKDAFGASKKPAVSSVRRLLSWVDRLDMNVWFVAHEISEWAVVGKERKEIGRMADVWDKVRYELDLEMRIEHPGPNLRVATITKSRIESLPEFDKITLQDGKNNIGYQEFAKRYGKDYIEAVPTQIVLATKEQTDELARLTGLLKVDEAEIEKILAKSGAETYAELTQERAGKFIDWLNLKFKPENK